MISVTNLTCTGCRACEQLCPVSCISMVEDEEGFLVAKADAERCINCGLCDRRCPVSNANADIRDSGGFESKAYALRWKADTETIMLSASGGAFPAFARAMLARGGVVYGAAFEEDFTVRHCRVDSVEDICVLQSSKYVQSDTRDTFRQVKEDLMEGVPVLYCGTPCQVAGLRAFLGERTDGLVTVDLVCHGVPSPRLWKGYLSWANRKYDKINSYNFRSKKCGWGHAVAINGERRRALVSSTDPFNKAFMSGGWFRESCYRCPWACPDRSGDITIGDFWGVQDKLPEFYCKDGVSCVLVNSSAGEFLFAEASLWAETARATFSDIAAGNANLMRPSPRPASRSRAYAEIRDISGESFTEQKLLPLVTLKDRFKSLVPFRVKYFVKRHLKRF